MLFEQGEQRLQGDLNGLREGLEFSLDLVHCFDQFGFRIVEQGREQRVNRCCAHDAASVFLRDFGMSANTTLPCCFLPNNDPSDTPPEQPLPKVNPQLLLSLKLSSACSLCDDGPPNRSL